MIANKRKKFAMYINRDQRQQLGIEMHHYILCVGGLQCVSDDVRGFFLDIIDSNAAVELVVDIVLISALFAFLDEVMQCLSVGVGVNLPRYSCLGRLLAEAEVELLNNCPGKG